MRRLHDPSVFIHDERHGSSLFWETIRDRIKEELGVEPFTQLPVGHPRFQYLFSKEDTKRFEIYKDDKSYELNMPLRAAAAKVLPAGAGPVELKIAAFMLDPSPEMGVVIGGMGSGKTTTIRFVGKAVHDAAGIACHVINFNKHAMGPYQSGEAAEILLRQLDPLVTELLEPDEEFGACWDWAFSHYHLSDDTAGSHGAVSVLEPAVSALRVKYPKQWKQATTPEEIAARAALLSTVSSNIPNKLQYLGLRLDYILSVLHKDQRHRICIVLDNIDPMPPVVQRELLMYAAQLQETANCKVLMAMRPLTYSLTSEQRGHRTIEVIQHIGPPTMELIADRVDRLIQGTSFKDFHIRVSVPNGPDREMGEAEVHAWARQIVTDLRDSAAPGGTSHATSAERFIDGLCNHSLRNSLLVADKLFGSNHLLSMWNEETGHLKGHELIRGVLLGRHCHFQADLTRVTDNLFDLGTATAAHSLTCKYRILRELSRSPGQGILHLDDVLARIRPFGYDDRVILESVNGLIAQSKRLAWSDKVVAYTQLDEPMGSRLCISKAGNFYVNQAVHSLEYVQEVHVDVLLPEDVGPRTYDHSRFSERFGSLYEFVRYLHQEDVREVRLALANGASPQRYVDTYGKALFSSEVARSMARQVQNIGNSRLRHLRPGTTRHEIEAILERWTGLDHLLGREDQSVLDALHP